MFTWAEGQKTPLNLQMFEKWTKNTLPNIERLTEKEQNFIFILWLKNEMNDYVLKEKNKVINLLEKHNDELSSLLKKED